MSRKKTTEEFCSDGCFQTNDVGKIDKDTYLHIGGRNKDLIISGGLNIYPKEIEDVINQMPNVVETAVVGLPHPNFGEAVAAVIVASTSGCTKKLVLEHCQNEMAAFKCPKAVVFVDELPRNTMSKVVKAKPRETYSESLTG